MKPMLRWMGALAIAATPALATAQVATPAAEGATPPAPTVGPPVQRIATASAVSAEAFGNVASVRELPDGRVLVNDVMRRRLLLMDSTLTRVEVVLDSLTDVPNSYGMRPGALIPARGDSTLFVDPTSFAVLVIDPEGRVVKVRAVWRGLDVPYFSTPTGTSGWPGIDARGRAVYRVPVNSTPNFAPFVPRDAAYTTMNPDSAFLVAVDLQTRAVDTLAVLRIPISGSRTQPFPSGMGFSNSALTNPLPATDDWAVFPDGGVAVVRGQDYRVEFLNPDGSWARPPRLPYDWQRVTDEEKKRMIDSVRTAQLQMRRAEFVSATIRWVNQYRQRYPERFTIPEGYSPPAGFGRDWVFPDGITFPANYIYACAEGETPVPVMPPAGAAPPGAAGPGGAPPINTGGASMTMMSTGAGAIAVSTAPTLPGLPPGATPSCIPQPVVLSGGSVPQPPVMRQVAVVEPEHLPDYRPPLSTGGSVRADLDGNLWIRANPMRPTPGGPVYDIVNRQGELVTRYQLPPGYTVVGFGKGKVVFLSMRDQTGIHLARVRLR